MSGRPDFASYLNDFLSSRSPFAVAVMDQQAGNLHEVFDSKGINPRSVAVNNGMLALLAFIHDIVDDAYVEGRIDGNAALLVTSILVGTAAALTTMRPEEAS